jgi:hypothetical protein
MERRRSPRDPEDRASRPSKALAQATAVLVPAERSSPRTRAYIVLSLLIFARNEELQGV